jgi:hypothetical protein
VRVVLLELELQGAPNIWPTASPYYLSEGQFIGPPVIMAKLIVDDLPAVYRISANTGASFSAGVRTNVETTERAFVVFLYLCGPKAIG